MLETLRLETMADLANGTAGKIIDNEIRRAVADLADRGEQDGEKRKVTIELTLLVKNKLASVQVKAKAALPPYNAGLTAAKLGSDDDGELTLAFQADNPENPDQPTLADHLPLNEKVS